jgi:transposase
MNVPNKFIKTLVDKDYQQLIENYQTATNFRVRNRSHAILLSFQKYSIDEIADICGVHRNAVSRWINRWNELGLDSLEDVQRNGRPPILTVEEQEKAFEIAMKNPKFPHRQLSQIKAETGKQISKFTLKDLIKKRLSMEKNQVRTVEKD